MASFVSRLGSTVMNSGCSGGRDFMASEDTKWRSQSHAVTNSMAFVKTRDFKANGKW